MEDDAIRDTHSSHIGRYAFGALFLAGAVALFLYADGYFEPAVPGEPTTIIEAID
jgi:hypothetical protein